MRKQTLFLILFLSTLLNADEVYATFDVVSNKKADLSLASTGVIEQIKVDIGDHVKQGDLLLTLDNRDLKESVNLSKAELKLAEINYRFAKKAYDRYLKVKEVIDEGQFETYESSYEKAQISLQKAKASVAYKISLLNKSRLLAPFDGIIAKRFIEVGDGVSSAKMEPLFTLIDATKVKLIITFDEKYWKQVKRGDLFNYRVDGLENSFNATITKIHPTVNVKTRKATAEVVTSGLLPGLFGDGMIKGK